MSDRPASTETVGSVSSRPGWEGALARLRDPSPLGLAELLAISGARPPEKRGETPDFCRLLAERILKAGEPLLAYDVLSEGLERWPQDVRLRQLLALALARSGATERAHDILAELHREGHQDEETLGLLARTHKDLSSQARDPAERDAQLRQAQRTYEQAYRTYGLPWPGINAATTALLLGEAEHARTLAREIRSACQRMLDGGGDLYWSHATLGEAALILDDPPEAEAHYRQAAQLGLRQGRVADLSTTRRQARLILEHLGQDRAWLESCICFPRVVTFSGHMIDRPSRREPRFPLKLEDLVAREIATRLERLNAGFGYASAACGSDILFLEAMLARGGEIHLVLPFPPAEFRATSVDIIPGANWGERFDRVLRRATQVIVASDRGGSGSAVVYLYGNLLLDGLAILRAQMMDAEMLPLAVWDGRPGDGPGGTHSRVEHWRNQGRPYEVIDITALARAAGPGATPRRPEPAPPPAPSADAPGTAPAQRIVAMLFADAVGFSKLTEEEIPRFVHHFLGAIGDLVSRSPNAPVFKNTWGDGLFFVFTAVDAAGRFALELRQHLRGIDFVRRGLPASLSLRIALHAGPVYEFTDPVTAHTNYFGAHVSRAARIEPITPPGQVYASQPFAALASAHAVAIYASQPFAALVKAEGVIDFSCEYVGQIPLAKHYGTFPMYHVRPRA